MKIPMLLLPLLFQVIILSANENWIPIKPMSQEQSPKQNTKLDVNLSQVEPINKIIKNATAIKQLIDATSKKDKAVANDKKWFIFKEENK